MATQTVGLPGYIELHDDAIYLVTLSLRWHQIHTVQLRLKGSDGSTYFATAEQASDQIGAHIAVEVSGWTGDRLWWEAVITYSVPDDQIDYSVRMTVDWRAPRAP